MLLCRRPCLLRYHAVVCYPSIPWCPPRTPLLSQPPSRTPLLDNLDFGAQSSGGGRGQGAGRSERHVSAGSLRHQALRNLRNIRSGAETGPRDGPGVGNRNSPRGRPVAVLCFQGGGHRQVSRWAVRKHRRLMCSRGSCRAGLRKLLLCKLCFCLSTSNTTIGGGRVRERGRSGGV